MKVKVCGNVFQENFMAIHQLQPDYLGFILYEKSERYIDLNNNEIKRYFHQISIPKVAVSVNMNADNLINTLTTYNFEFAQLHGDENVEYCMKVKSSGVKVIKVIRVESDIDLQTADKYANACDYLLFDTAGKKYGGNGQKFNWNLLKNYALNLPFFLSGGIHPDDVDALKNFHHPAFWGIDINSGFESSPGMKNLEKIEKFLHKIRQKNE